MHTIPFALSVHKFINSVGADVGFASLIAVALLVILFFAQMRETSTLRERLDDAYNRIGGLEARIAQLIQLQQLRAQQPQQQAAARPAVTPPPARPMGSAVASVRRIPAAGAAPAAANGLRPAAPAGVGAPALASATKLIPDPVVVAAPAAAGVVAQETMVAAQGVNGGGQNLGAGAPVAPQPSLATAAAAAAATTGGPPRVQIRPEGPEADGGRRAAAPPREPAGQPRRFLDEGYRPRRDWGRRFLVGFGALVAIAAVVVVLLALTSNGSSSKTPAKTATTTTTAASTFKPGRVVVSVLNGTGVSGLAGDVGKFLVKQGYKVPLTEVTNELGTNLAVQDQQVTLVGYVKGNVKDAAEGTTYAQHVAATLKVKAAHVGVASQAAIQSCATSESGAASSCDAAVIVTLGADKSSFASGSN